MSQSCWSPLGCDRLFGFGGHDNFEELPVGQIFCVMSLSWDLSDITVGLEFRVSGRKASEIKCHQRGSALILTSVTWLRGVCRFLS